jgi:regulatory protein YycI of two-component signal transduction system YycFG
MTIFTSILLIVAIILVALFIAYQIQKGSKTLEEMRSNFYENEEIQEAVEVVKKAVEQASTEEVAKPKKKRKYYPKKPKTSI